MILIYKYCKYVYACSTYLVWYNLCTIVLETITDFVPSISLEPAMHTVGQQQAIICTAILVPGEDVNNSVLVTWVAPDSVNISDERVTIMPTAINGSNYTSVLHFDYLMETDAGIYICEIVSNRSTFTLPVDLQDLSSK